jgi:hypothetical protein
VNLTLSKIITTGITGKIIKNLNTSAVHAWGLSHAPYAYLTNFFRVSFPLKIILSWKLLNYCSYRYRYLPNSRISGYFQYPVSDKSNQIPVSCRTLDIELSYQAS